MKNEHTKTSSILCINSKIAKKIFASSVNLSQNSCVPQNSVHFSVSVIYSQGYFWSTHQLLMPAPKHRRTEKVPTSYKNNIEIHTTIRGKLVFSMIFSQALSLNIVCFFIIFLSTVLAWTILTFNFCPLVPPSHSSQAHTCSVQLSAYPSTAQHPLTIRCTSLPSAQTPGTTLGPWHLTYT